MNRFRIGIAGAAGYTGGELLRLLVHHPAVELAFAHSKSAQGKFVHQVHRDLLGETSLQFTSELSIDIDVLFLCLGHGESRKFLQAHPLPPRVKVIDLSQDFRTGASGFVYGLSEWNRESITNASCIANPGCFATAIQLALLPLVKNGVAGGEVHVSATTGSTGAGQSPSDTTHFSWRSNNVSTYKPFAHQHLDEMRSSIASHAAAVPDITFIPQRGSFSRGIHASVYTRCKLNARDCFEMMRATYDGSQFVFVTDEPVDLKQVVNTNKCFIHAEQHGDKLLVTSVIDNLLKGASGQAVQNMNIMLGLDEGTGLRLKATAY